MTAASTAAGLATFYPIVPDSDWVARIVPLGVKVVQLRLKSDDADDVRRQIGISLKAAAATGATLIVNDHWRAAIELGARYVHLGQEDLATADIAALRRAGIRIGISTHSEAELQVALAVAPDYVALGPIYETKLKAMTWAPQGLDRIRAWKTRIGDLPLVAIGGITIARAAGVLAAGAESVAVITDFVTAPDPDARIRSWVAWAAQVRPGHPAAAPA